VNLFETKCSPITVASAHHPGKSVDALFRAGNSPTCLGPKTVWRQALECAKVGRMKFDLDFAWLWDSALTRGGSAPFGADGCFADL
jgi:hypothetical protein